MSWRRMRMFGLGLFVVNGTYLLIQTVLTIIHYLLNWQSRSSCLMLALALFHVPPAIALLVVLYLALRVRNPSLIGMFIRCYAIYLLLIAMNTLFSMIAIASGYKSFDFYWTEDNPTLILIIDYLSAFVILFGIWICRQLQHQLQPSTLQIGTTHRRSKRIAGKPQVAVETHVGTSSHDATIESTNKQSAPSDASVHQWYTRMNVNGFVANEPEVIIRSPTPTNTQQSLAINCSSSSSTSSTESLPTTTTHIACRRKYHKKHRRDPERDSPYNYPISSSAASPPPPPTPISPVQPIWPPRGP